MLSNELYHYGVKGMKWRHRKAKSQRYFGGNKKRPRGKGDMMGYGVSGVATTSSEWKKIHEWSERVEDQYEKDSERRRHEEYTHKSLEKGRQIARKFQDMSLTKLMDYYDSEYERKHGDD